MAELIDDVERGISSGSTVLDYVIKNGLDRLKAKEAVFRPQCGVNACPTMVEMYENQAPEVGAAHLPIYRPTGLFRLNANSDLGQIM